MRLGDVVGERFEIANDAGAGGMATVYRARDRLTGRPVALKVLEERNPRLVARFVREAQLLCELEHLRIVRYLTHGVTPDGQWYLVLEWLDGADLSDYLAEAYLSVAASLELARQVAEGLAYAHSRGIIHRDIKPSNVFLVGGDPRSVKLLDFGVARLTGAATDLTALGTRVGTPAYMAPEQARGLTDLDARVDVFALGVLLYQCLTRRKPFPGDDLMAVMGKIILAEPEPIRRLRPDVPPEVAELVSQLLAKDPAARPKDGAAVVAAIDALGPIAGDQTTTPLVLVGVRPSLTSTERRLVALVLARGGPPPESKADDRLRAAVERHGGRVDRLADGSIVLTLTSGGAATDLAARAAQLALAARRLIPGATLALATGRSAPTLDGTGTPFGDVIDRAAAMLRAAPAPAPFDEPIVHLDDVTAGLLGPRFDVAGDAAGLILCGERADVDSARTLLGRPTPCVARDAELAAIEGAYSACVNEGGGRVVLVTAPPGVGKSRLRSEALARLARRDDRPEVLIGRGDPMSAGAPFVLLAGAIRSAAGLQAGEPLAARRLKLKARVARHVPEADVQRVAEFLGEMVGTTFNPEESVQLRAARADSKLRGDQMQRAFEEWLAAECSATPVVLVLEDLHWGDQPTVTFVDAALRNLADRPLLVLALARPEVHTTFPRLWAGRQVSELRLGELGRRPAEKLVRAVLGDAIEEWVVARVVERAGGNAFYLEELIRAVAEGDRDGERLPETVLAMLHARLEAMEPGARQVLRAASVFGDVFWRGGVCALLGGQERTTQTSDWLAELARREVMTIRPLSRFRGEQEYVFRHAMVREAAYAMLTDEDRRLGHRLAGEWLAAAGESDAVVLAEHFERGGEPRRAAEEWRKGAEHALGGNDLEAALARARRGIKSGATGETLGRLQLLEAEAHAWRGEFADAETAAVAAIAQLARRSEPWFAAIGEAAAAAGVQGNSHRLHWLLAQLGETRASEPDPREVLAAAHLSRQLLITGSPAEARRVLAGLSPFAARFRESEPDVAGRVSGALEMKARYEGDAATALELAEDSAECFARAGDQRNACTQRGRLGYAKLEIGAHEEAEHLLREVANTADRMGLQNVAAAARHNLGLALSRQGKHDQARSTELAAAAAFRASGNRRMEGASYEYLALIEIDAGRVDAAEGAARQAVAIARAEPPLPLNEAESLAILARALLAAGRVAEAREASQRGLHLLEELGGIDDGEALIRLTWAEILAAAGDPGAGAAALAARDRLLARAERIRDPRVRAMFMDKVPENAATIALAARVTR